MSDSNFAIRLKLFMDAVGLTPSQLADRCGIPRPSLSAILSGRNKKISDTLIGQIHAVYPQLSVLWLMFDEGDMFLSSSGLDSSSFAIDGLESEDSPLNSVNSGNEESFDPYERSDRKFSDLPDLFAYPSSGSSTADTNRNSGAQASGSVKNGNRGPKSEFQNQNFPTNRSDSAKETNLNGLESDDFEAQSRMNKGFEGDLRTIALMRQIENMRKNPRKVTQITIYYDDSTFESFYPSHS